MPRWMTRARVPSMGILVVALFLVGCGQRETANNTANVLPSDSLALNVGAAQTVAGLQVRIEQIQSNGATLPQLGLNCGRHLVLAQLPTSAVSSTDVQAIKDFLALSPVDADDALLPGASLPSSLLWAAGSVPLDQNPARCEGILELSNASSQPIVIAGTGVTVDVGPIAPRFHYNQLDVCSFGAIGCGHACTGFCGGAGSCGYETNVVLGDDAHPGKRYKATLPMPTGGDDADCPWPLLLSPGDSTAIAITISPPVQSPTGIYRVTPFVVTAGGTMLDYPNLVTHLAYVSASDFTCFDYHNNSFAPIQPNDGVRHRCL